MQNLRDKLLKAGLVDKKQARKSKTEKRRARKEKGGAKATAEQLRDQQARYQEKLAQQKAAARELQQQLNKEQEDQARQGRIRDLIRTHRVKKPKEETPFFFAGADKKILKVFISLEVANSLESGQMAIVAGSDDPRRDWAVISHKGASKLEQLAPERILFWNQPQSSD